ncbi:GNVR domain-containing protein [Halomonas sp. E19]|uniref:GNVR domain-containing protein n=1 Tax=Halomonas sp. E19 TaxID=3397247 RepID=UPI004033893B
MLSQAEQIAEQLGILQPTTPRELGRQQGERDVIYAEINSQNGLPLYFMGTEALRTERQVIEQNLYEEVKTAEIREIEKEISSLQNNREIEAILAREEESPFIDTYNRLKEENLLLRSNSVSADEIQVAEVVRWAYQPTKPDSPKKSLMLVLAVVAGFMIGIFMVVISGFAKTIKKRRQIAI